MCIRDRRISCKQLPFLKRVLLIGDSERRPMGMSRFDEDVYKRQAQEDLTALLSGLEAHIDYPDEIDEDEALAGLREGLDKLLAQLDGAIDERGARIVRCLLYTSRCV